MRKTYLCCPDHIHHRDCNGHLILAIFIVCRLQVPVNEYVLIFHFWSNFVTAGTRVYLYPVNCRARVHVYMHHNTVYMKLHIHVYIL